MSQALTACFVFLKCQTVSSINTFLQVLYIFTGVTRFDF